MENNASNADEAYPLYTTYPAAGIIAAPFAPWSPVDNPDRPIDGDAIARHDAAELSERLQKIAGFPLLPWQESYLNAAYEAAKNGIRASVALPPARRHA